MKQLVEDIKQLSWENYAWLLYSIPYVIASFADEFRWGWTAVMVGAYVVFLPVYLIGRVMRGPQVIGLMVLLDVMAITISWKNPGAAVFFIYAASIAGHAFPMPQSAYLLVVQVAVGGLSTYLLGMPAWFYIMSTVIAALIGAVQIQYIGKQAADARLRLAQDEVERLAKLAERERIARDLHDLLGHTLSVVVLKTELARKLIDRDPVRAAQEIAEVERIAREGLAEVREAITGYRSSGLAAEIEHVRETLTAAGIETTIDKSALTLPPAHETALSLALREAVTNVIRHARATSCHVAFYAQDESILMTVEDNGRGGNAPFGNGLTGMRERITALGGMLDRQTDRGTRLLIRLPTSAFAADRPLRRDLAEARSASVGGPDSRLPTS